MNALRGPLLLASLGAAGFMLYICLTERHSWPITLPCAAGLLLNAAYLGFADPIAGRLPRLISLWFDTKEAELKQRMRKAAETTP